jgi:PadR family transcriptional regulator, regulatory protein PadR
MAELDLALTQEMRRGTLVLAVLSAIGAREYCGADLKTLLLDADLPIEEGALYPMLRRLEDQGLLSSDRRPDGPRVKRFYSLSKAGRATHRAMLSRWASLSRSLERLNGAEHGNR